MKTSNATENRIDENSTIEFTPIYYTLMARIHFLHDFHNFICVSNGLSLEYSRGLVQALVVNPASFLTPRAFRQLHYIPNTCFAECHCVSHFSRLNKQSDARASLAEKVAFEAIDKKNASENVHIAVVGSGQLAETIFLVAVLLRVGITTFRLDLIDLLYAGKPTNVIFEQFNKLLQALNFHTKTDPSCKIEYKTFQNLENYRPSQPVIVHESDFCAADKNREQLVSEALKRLPANSVWCAAFKKLTPEKELIVDIQVIKKS